MRGEDVTKVNKQHIPKSVFTVDLKEFWSQVDRARGEETDDLEISSGLSTDDPQAEVQDYLDANVRHTWALTPSPEQFYRLFRITPPAEAIGSNCFHAVGLELYGDVHEE